MLQDRHDAPGQEKADAGEAEKVVGANTTPDGIAREVDVRRVVGGRQEGVDGYQARHHRHRQKNADEEG